MKTNLLVFIAVLLTSITYGQTNKIAVQNGTETRYYKTLDSVVKYLRDNDKVYLTEGVHKKNKPNTNITDSLRITKKNVTFYGVGYDARHTGVQSPTIIQGSIAVKATNTSFVGINIPRTVIHQYNSLFIKRCQTSSMQFKEKTNGFISRSKVQSIIIYDDTSLTLNNNVIGSVRGVSKSYYSKRVNLNVKNNIITQYLGYTNAEGSSIKSSNNIFLFTQLYSSNGYYHFNQVGSFQNNIFRYDVGWSENTSHSNNKVGVDPKFVDSKDYILDTGSPAKSAGTDGSDCGIYGGSFPFNYNSTIPKILKLNIAGATDDNGKLKVIFDVEAQKQ